MAILRGGTMNKVRRKDIEAILKLTDEINELNETAKNLEYRKNFLIQNVMNELKHNAAIEFMPYRLMIKEDKKRTVSWKSIVIDRLGKDFADDILNFTPEKITEKLIIEPSAELTNKRG